MKILILAVRDTGGTGYTLAHAVNKVEPEHQCVNMRGTDNFLRYPAIVEMGYYNRTRLREMVYKSDVVVFLGAMKPFFESFKLRKNRMRDIKKILLCMGSEWRYGREKLLKQADKMLRDYKVVLGGADMFLPYPEDAEPVGDNVAYLPVVRSFSEITRRFSLCKQDQAAREAFGVNQVKVTFTHAPTSEVNKGSQTFYKVATRAMQACPSMRFTTIRLQPWISCLQTLGCSDVLFDQAPPFPTAYGALSVEAAVFHVPSFSQVDARCAAWLKEKTGLDTPFITFKDEEDLFNKVCALATQPKVRKMFGDLSYRYCKAVHDEKPVVERFLQIIEKMN